MSKTTKLPFETTQDFAELVNPLAVYSEAHNRLSGLETALNGEYLELVDDHKKDYAELQEVLTRTETALEAIARAHPDWFKSKKSIKTPYGTAKFHAGTRLEIANEEATVKLLRAEERADAKFKADDFIRKSEAPNLEALENLPDEVLSKFMVKRVKEEKFAIAPAKLDMGKAVKEAVEKEAA